MMADAELDAMKNLFETLEPLEPEARVRVLNWISGRLDLTLTPVKSQKGSSPDLDQEESGESKTFKTFADLYNAASPVTYSDKALVAGYWLQKCQGQEDFPSQSVNKELLNLGHGLTNVTDAFDQLKGKKPALAIQVRKSGKSQQARKLYKLTQAGIDTVLSMIQ